SLGLQSPLSQPRSRSTEPPHLHADPVFGPYGINNAGQIVGVFADGTGVHSFLKDGATFTTIDVPGAVFTGANGINDAGQIVGGFNDVGEEDHGFLKDGATFTTIDVPGGKCCNYGQRDRLVLGERNWN